MGERIVVIEDEEDIRKVVRYNLEREGFRVVAEADAERGIERIFRTRPDAVVLDLMLPGASGLEVLREIRSEPLTAELPVIVVTARAAEMDTLLGFQFGADDYLTKPFDPRELVARLRAVLRRARPVRERGALRGGPIEVDLEGREVRVEGERIVLTRREFDLLAYLLQHRGRVLSREELLRKVWGYDFVGDTRTVDVHVRRLRRKLGSSSHWIETVPRAGYKFASQPDAA